MRLKRSDPGQNDRPKAEKACHKKLTCVVTMIVSAVSLVSAPSMSAADATKQFVYFGTYTGQKSKGIYLAHFDPAQGTLSQPELVAESKNPTFLALNPKGNVLYAANEVADFGGNGMGAISAFSLDRASGKLTLLNQQPSGGAGPCHLAVGRSGKCVLVANYGSGSVAALPIETEGRLLGPSSVVQHHGSSVNPQRQEGPHAHFITWDRAEKFVLACDLGLDKVLIYQMDSDQRRLSANNPAFISIAAGSGPRHLAFDPNGRVAYLLNEMSSTLTVCSYDPDRGQLKELQTLSTLPEGFTGANTCAEVQVHPSGRFVYASNRGHNSVAVFGIETATGSVKLIQHQSTLGKTPRHFSLDPSAKWLLAENQDSDDVFVFAVDQQSGRLSPTGQSRKLGAPVCAVFVP